MAKYWKTIWPSGHTAGFSPQSFDILIKLTLSKNNFGASCWWLVGYDPERLVKPQNGLTEPKTTM